MYLVDSPGYGFAMRSRFELESWKKLMDLYFKEGNYLHRTICLVSTEDGIEEFDEMVNKTFVKKILDL